MGSHPACPEQVADVSLRSGMQRDSLVSKPLFTLAAVVPLLIGGLGITGAIAGQAIGNARRLRELLPRVAPELEVVEPFTNAPAEPRQRSLFE